MPQSLLAADGDVRADLKSTRQSLSLTCLYDCSTQWHSQKIRMILARLAVGQVLAAWRAAGPGQVGDQVPGDLVQHGARVGGGCNQPPDAIQPPPA